MAVAPGRHRTSPHCGSDDLDPDPGPGPDHATDHDLQSDPTPTHGVRLRPDPLRRPRPRRASSASPRYSRSGRSRGPGVNTQHSAPLSAFQVLPHYTRTSEHSTRKPPPPLGQGLGHKGKLKFIKGAHPARFGLLLSCYFCQVLDQEAVLDGVEHRCEPCGRDLVGPTHRRGQV